MADKDDNTDDPKDLRTKLQAALDLNKNLNTQVSELQSQVFMPTLNARQRRVVMRELETDKLDLSEENIKSVAEDLGYKLDPEPPPPDPALNQNNEQGDNGQEEEENGDIMVSLSNMSAIDQANYQASRGNVRQDLDTKMRNAKTREELRDIVRNEGHASGLVHEWDFE